jgi:hypothetical protein
MSGHFQFSGISGAIDEQVMHKFEAVYDSGEEVIYVSPVLTHEEEELTHNYVYVVKAIDYANATGEPEQEGNWYITVDYVIHPDSICDKLKKSVMESTDGYFEIQDLLWHGGANVTVLDELVAEEELDHAVKAAMTCVSAVDGMRGFYLDESWNQIGSTGWDTIKYAIGQQKDIFPWSR